VQVTSGDNPVVVCDVVAEVTHPPRTTYLRVEDARVSDIRHVLAEEDVLMADLQCDEDPTRIESPLQRASLTT
jgi:hypothetical protein